MPANYMHSATPWVVETFADGAMVNDANGIVVCVPHGETFEQAQSNAQRIALCCNEHEKLLARIAELEGK